MRNRLSGAVGVLVLALGVIAGGITPALAVNSGGTQVMYRLYNRVSHEHLYTADANERDVLSRGDWTYEGVGWVAPKKSSAPVYRLYNPVLCDHHYTKDTNEVNVLTSRHGWRYEGIGWHSSDSKEVVVYRQFNPGLRVGSHNYTTDHNEYTTNNRFNGWRGEGIAWYAVAEGWQRGADPYVKMGVVAVVDKDGKTSDTFTIPSTMGLLYKAGGKVVGAGTYKVADYFSYGASHEATVVVTAEPAAAGYRISGASTFTAKVNGISTVAPTAPTFSDVNGRVSDTFTIPSQTGVQYQVNGTNIAAGTYLTKDYFSYKNHKATATVTAVAKDGYRLSGPATWSSNYSGIRTLTPKAVTFADEDGKANDTFTIPSQSGVQYQVNGTNIAAGTYKVADYFDYGTAYSARATVTAVAKKGYAINGASSWTAAIDGRVQVVPGSVTFRDQDGQARDTFTVPATTGVVYTAGGRAVGAGTYKVGDYFSYPNYVADARVSATPAAGYKFAAGATTQWAATIDGYTSATAASPTFVDNAGKLQDTYTIPNVTGVQYVIGGRDVAPGTYNVTTHDANGQATVAVAYKAKAGYRLTNPGQQWIGSYTAQVMPSEVVFFDPNGAGSDTVTIPELEGVYYTIDGVRKAPGTYRVQSQIGAYSNHFRHMSVHAYLEDGYTFASSAGVYWFHQFTDGVTQTPGPSSSATSDYGNYTTAQAQKRIEAYARALDGEISRSSTYAAYTTIGQIYGEGAKVTSSTYGDPEKEINRRFAQRFLQRTTELRATVGLNELPLMRLSDSDEAESFAHAVYTQAMSSQYGYGHYVDDPHLVGIYERTRNSGTGMGYDGTRYLGPAENLAWNSYGRRTTTPEEMADRMIAQYIGEYPYLHMSQAELDAAGEQNGHLKTLLRDSARCFSASFHIYREVSWSGIDGEVIWGNLGAITAENYSW